MATSCRTAFHYSFNYSYFFFVSFSSHFLLEVCKVFIYFFSLLFQSVDWKHHCQIKMVLACVQMLSHVHLCRCTVSTDTLIIQCALAVLWRKKYSSSFQRRHLPWGPVVFSIDCIQGVCSYYISYFLLFTWNSNWLLFFISPAKS